MTGHHEAMFIGLMALSKYAGIAGRTAYDNTITIQTRTKVLALKF